MSEIQEDSKVKIHYIDSENISLSSLDHSQFSVLDRVFVFTNNKTLEKDYRAFHYSFVGDYPAGKDQADFYIIAHLGSLLSRLLPVERKNAQCILHSNDQVLCKAFSFQCSLVGVACKLEGSPAKNTVKDKPPKNVAPVVPLPKIEQRIVKLANKPIKAVDIKKSLSISEPCFTRYFNRLVSKGVLMRDKSSKRHWIAAKDL